MAMASAGTGLLALAAIGVGAISAAGVLLVLALGSGLYARHWISLAGRSRVGARSEDEVRRALEHLRAEGWRLRHSLPWRGRGDIDSLAIAPTRVAFAIETKTRSYDDRHLARVREQAVWLSRRRRRWFRRGALPVVCLVRPAAWSGSSRTSWSSRLTGCSRLYEVAQADPSRTSSASGGLLDRRGRSRERACIGSLAPGPD